MGVTNPKDSQQKTIDRNIGVGPSSCHVSSKNPRQIHQFIKIQFHSDICQKERNLLLAYLANIYKRNILALKRMKVCI